MSTMTTVDTRPVSAAQMKYIRDLRNDGQRYENLIAAYEHRTPTVPEWHDPNNMSHAHRMIGNLKEIVSAKRSRCKVLGLDRIEIGTPVENAPVHRAPQMPVFTAPVTITEGMWVLPSLTGNGDTYVKVQRNVAMGDGMHLYGKRLDSDGRFISAPGILRDLRSRGRKMSFEEAREYGKLYGTCVSCHHPLTHEDSVYNLYGKKCAENHGWPYAPAPKL
jgi:hypothetical protein